MGDCHDHGVDHPDYDPWGDDSGPLPERTRCRGECRITHGATVRLTGYTWQDATGVVKWSRLRDGRHRLGLTTRSPYWHGRGLIFVDCCEVEAA